MPVQRASGTMEFALQVPEVVLMKRLNIDWSGIEDSTGFLFSFAKSLAAAVKNSPYSELYEDVVATSGFAFRMWVDPEKLCPSATSIWDFESQKKWVENCGLICNYIGRYWDQDDIEKERREKAIEIIRESINRGIPAVSWDIGIPEWGLVIGYNDDENSFEVLSVQGDYLNMPYDVLGKREVPILSVLTLAGKSDKSHERIYHDALKIAISHLKGNEWCGGNKSGLEAYPALISFFDDKFSQDLSWNMEYCLGTYGALKSYASRYFEKAGSAELAGLYKRVHDNWIKAFNIKRHEDVNDRNVRERIIGLLKDSCECEEKALEKMEKAVS